MSHTPGPWINDGDMIVSARTRDQMPDKFIACAYSSYGSGEDHARAMAENRMPSREETHANANLLAAAPEMLEELAVALRALQQEAEGYEGEWDDPRNSLYEDCQRLTRIIKKARGE